MPSASLVPASFDPTVLLTTAGMQPFKPYFRGEEAPPSPRLTSCQKVFRTTDIENVGLTARHLTFFEMLGNFSVGDYFKQGAAEFAWELSTRGLRLRPGATIWITVFGGDDELGRRTRRGGHRGAGGRSACPRSGSCAWAWRTTSGSRARPGRAARARSSTWTAGWTSAGEDDRPGDDTERFLEYWNLVFMQFELHGDGSLTELPQQNIDTGLGLDRMAAILQDVPSVFETGPVRAADRLRRAALGPAVTARTSRPPGRCGSWPTTAAAPPS